MLQVAVFTLLLLPAGCCFLIGGIKYPTHELSVLLSCTFPEFLTLLLLPAGCCFLIGGIKHPIQEFSVLPFFAFPEFLTILLLLLQAAVS